VVRADVSGLAANLAATGVTVQTKTICVLGAASSPHVVTRAEAFASRGYDVRLLSPVSGRSDVIPVDFPRSDTRGLLGKMRLLWWTATSLLRQRADIFHAHYAAEVGTWLAWLLGRRPLVISVMGGDVLFDEQGSLGPLGRWLTRRALLGADLVTVKTPDLADVVAGFGVPRANIETVIWGVDLDTHRFDETAGQAFRQEIGIGPDQAIVFSPRIMHPFYNIDLLVDAWPEVIRLVPQAVLVISTFGGAIAYREHLQRRAEALGVAHAIIFAPARPTAAMAGAYSGSELIVSIPPSDGFPQAVLEAAACGRPMVLSDLARLHSFFTPDVDVLYTELSISVIARTIFAALSDPATSARRAEAAYRKVAAGANFRENVDRVEGRFMQLMKAG